MKKKIKPFINQKSMKYILISFLSFACIFTAEAQNFQISGYIRDNATGENLINANIYEQAH